MAPFAHRVTRVTISGTSFGGAEEWSTGFYMGNESADADMPNQQLADDIRAAWATFFTTAGVNVSTAWTSTLVKVSSFGTDGKSNAADTMFSTFPTLTKGANAQLFPPQIALVATLASTLPRGVGAKGRMYLPGISATLDATGHLSSTNVTAISTALKTFLDACNASTATNNVVVNASHGSLNEDGTPKIGGKSPIIKAVTSLKVGNVYDTQRRRRNSLAEVYTTTSLV